MCIVHRLKNAPMQYEKKDPYNVERHNNALDLNFTYVGADKYKLPKNWNGDDIVVDLSATGKEQFQILKSVCIQLVEKQRVKPRSLFTLTSPAEEAEYTLLESANNYAKEVGMQPGEKNIFTSALNSIMKPKDQWISNPCLPLEPVTLSSGYIDGDKTVITSREVVYLPNGRKTNFR